VTKTRFSISVDAEHAERIKAAAARAGQDVSAYMSRAALEAAAHDERIRDIFADVDARIELTEGAAVSERTPPPPADTSLSSAERTAIAARWDAFFNTATHGAA
jgi:hypothetical protein